MGNFRQRIGLVHELGELRRAEELLDYGRRRLVIHQFLRHQGLDILQTHPLLDRTLHPHQTDAELIFDQLADGADPAIAQMIDIVDLAIWAAILKLDQIAHYFENIFAPEGALLERDIELKLVVELQPADLRQVITLRIEEKIVEEGGRSLQSWRITRPQPPIDFKDGVV